MIPDARQLGRRNYISYNKLRRAAAARWSALVAALAAIGAVVAGFSYFRESSLRYAVQRGRELLTEVEPGHEASALAAWADETRASWAPRRERMVRRLLRSHPEADPAVRRMLEQVGRVSFADRADHWQRWQEIDAAVRQDGQPITGGRERVRLEILWEAPVGLTDFFSTILPLDGTILVPSLGGKYDDPADPHDGIVRIDGSTGESGYLFQPGAAPGQAADILGLAVTTDAIYASCRDGYVYKLSPDGTVVWKCPLGSPAVSAPTIRQDKKNTLVYCVTAEGKIVAIRAASGKTRWVSRAPKSAAPAVGCTLALERTGANRAILWVTEPGGALRAFDAITGEPIWRSTLGPGLYPGAIVRPNPGGLNLLLADRAGELLAVLTSNNPPSLLSYGRYGDATGEGTTFAAVRTITHPSAGELVLLCPTGQRAGPAGSICAIDGQGLYWRAPTYGHLRGTPAIADVNRVPGAEIIVGEIDADGAPDRGALAIYSADGLLLARHQLPAPVDSAPVVADVDGDQRLEILIADRGGKLYCLKTHRSGVVEWGTLGGDAQNTRDADRAYEFGQRPYGFQWK